jgi:hypothetical protein
MEDDPVVICAKRFVRAMLDNDQSTAEAMISPKWLDAESISMDSLMVSRLYVYYVPHHTPFKITDVRGDIVSVLTAPDSGCCGQQLSVKVSDENGKYYIEPSGADYCCYSVDPWYWPPEPQPDDADSSLAS